MTLETTPMSERITTLLTHFGLSTAAREWVPRFVQAQQDGAFPVTRELLELAEDRRQRRIAR
jgi:endo-beta-N-acetylglucosaminidase D